MKKTWLKIAAWTLGLLGVTSCGTASKASKVQEIKDEHPSIEGRVKLMYGVPPTEYKVMEAPQGEEKE